MTNFQLGISFCIEMGLKLKSSHVVWLIHGLKEGRPTEITSN